MSLFSLLSIFLFKNEQEEEISIFEDTVFKLGRNNDLFNSINLILLIACYCPLWPCNPNQYGK